jgi:hypothetical protein
MADPLVTFMAWQLSVELDYEPAWMLPTAAGVPL